MAFVLPWTGGSTGYTVYGKSGWRVASNGEIVTDKYALDRCVAVWECDPKTFMSGIPQIGSPHPLFYWMGAVRRTINMAPRKMVTATMEYEGSYEAESQGDDGGPPQWELIAGVSEELIETHPDFVTDIGGKPTAPINGAVFVDRAGNEYRAGNPAPNENAKLAYFDLLRSDGDKNKFAGLEAYLDLANIECRKTWMSKRVPKSKARDGGKISAPDWSELPEFDADRNWLHLGLTVQQRGLAYQNSIGWRLSGRGGHLPEVYK